MGGGRWLKAASAGENEGKNLADRAVGAQAGRASAEGRRAGVAREAACSLPSKGTELYRAWERRGLHRR